MKLYYSPGACSLAPHIVIKELGLNCELIPVDLRKKTIPTGDYLAVNAKGSVPALQLDNGQLLTETSVLLQYLADQKPEKNLIPKFGQWERYRCMEWLNFVSSEMHKGIGIFFGLDNLLSTQEAKSEYREKHLQNLNRRFQVLEKHFSQNSYLMGEQFSVADAYLYVVLTWTKVVKIDLSPWKSILGFMEKMKNHPAVQEALVAEGFLKS